LTEEKKKQIEAFRQDLIRLSRGLSIGDFRKSEAKRTTTPS
jgi:hypothetical protein